MKHINSADSGSFQIALEAMLKEAKEECLNNTNAWNQLFELNFNKVNNFTSYHRR